MGSTVARRRTRRSGISDRPSARGARGSKHSSGPLLSQVARHLIMPDDVVATGWPAVRDRIRLMGKSLDPWQQGIAKLVLSKGGDGLYATGIDGIQVSIPRQVGKTYTFGLIVFALCSLEPSTLTLWTAHHMKTVNETFIDFKSLANDPDIKPYIYRVREGNGNQAVEFVNGSRILFGARSMGFGRGFHEVDILVFDEAQILPQKALDDMVPTTNAAPNPLILRMGTPPRPTDPSEAFTNFRSDAIKGQIKNGLYVEISADEDADPEDRDQWRKANPSFPHRVNVNAMLRMKRQMGPESFRREGLGIWDRAAGVSSLDPDLWRSLTIEPSEVGGGARWCAAVRFSVDGGTLALARAGRYPGTARMVHVELATEQGVRPLGDGVSWALDYLVDNREHWCQIVVEGKAGAGDFVDRLRSAGFGAPVIWTPTADQAATAHAMMEAAVRDCTISHLDDEELSSEIATSTRRPIGKAGGFGWQAAEGFTCAGLDAITLAHWAAKTTKRRPHSAAASGMSKGGALIL